jgi:WD40 repeat protein
LFSYVWAGPNASLSNEEVMSRRWMCVWLAAGLVWSGLAPLQGRQTDDTGRFREGTASVRVDRYGDPLPEGAIARLGTIRYRAGTFITCAAVSSDGRLLAMGTYDRGIHLLDAATGKELHRLATGSDRLNRPFRLAFSPDTKWLASMEEGGAIRFWDTTSGAALRRLKVELNIDNVIVFSADARVVAGVKESEGNGAQIVAWDTGSGRKLGPITVLQNQNVRVAISAGGDLVATWGDFHERESEQEKRQEITQTIQIWRMAEAKELRRLTVPRVEKKSDAIVKSVAFSPDGCMLAAATDAGTIVLWDLATGQERHRLNGDSSFDALVAFSPDGKILASSSRRLSGRDPVRLWDTATGKHLGAFPAPSCSHLGVFFAPDGPLMAYGVAPSMVRLWDIRTGKAFGPERAHTSPVTAVASTPDGSRLVYVDFDGALRSWELHNGEQTYRVPFEGGRRRLLAASKPNRVFRQCEVPGRIRRIVG